MCRFDVRFKKNILRISSSSILRWYDNNLYGVMESTDWGADWNDFTIFFYFYFYFFTPTKNNNNNDNDDDENNDDEENSLVALTNVIKANKK